jgi:poly(3-hydroxybutyrate) depolymerase
MRSQVELHSEEAEQRVRATRRATRRQYLAEEKVRISGCGAARRRQHRRAVPQGRDQPESLLPLVQGLHGSRQAAAGG